MKAQKLPFVVSISLILFVCFLSSLSQAAQVQLAWDGPTTYEDGTPLSVAGYKLYYGQTSGNYGLPIDVGNQTTYTVTGLIAGQTYYFTVTAYDIFGNESVFADEVSISIPPDPPTTQVTIWVEAEAGVLRSPMSVNTNTQASGGQYIWVSNGTGDVWDPTKAGGEAEYTFTVPTAGIYTIWGRVISNNSGDDSFFVSLDNGPYALWDTLRGGTETWVWDQVNNRGVADPVLFTLSVGTHTLRIKQREDGTKLDKLLLTTDLSFIPTGVGGTGTSPPPVAGFSATPTTGTAPLAVTFTDASTGDIDSRIWSFGDGSTSTATNPTYTYATAGTYTVSLTVTGPGGSDTETKTNYITVTTSSSSLVAGFRTTTPTSGPAPLIVKFADASTGTITRRTWDFGDGSTTRGKNPKHIYYNAGTYTVSLTVKGPDGSDTETKPDYITVTTSAASSVAGFRATTPTSGSMPFSVGGPHGSDTETETGLITGQPSDLTARWTDYRVMLTMWSTDNDALGVIFRYQDPDNYYRFSWDKDRTYRQLVKQVNGVFTLLAEDAVPYIQNQTYQVEIVAQGSWLAVWIDGVRIFVVTDSSFMGGAIALYSWANTGSYFDNILVEDLRTGNILLWEDFADGDLTSWMIFDEGTTSAPSVWSATNGALVQSRNIYAAPIDRANLSKRGTFALYAIDNTQ